MPLNEGGNHMAEKKIIAVVGATGAQGGGLARAILADPNGDFACRAAFLRITYQMVAIMTSSALERIREFGSSDSN